MSSSTETASPSPPAAPGPQRIPPLPVQRCPELTLPAGLTLAEITQHVLEATLLVNEGNMTSTAKALGICRRTIYNLMNAKAQKEPSAAADRGHHAGQ